MNKLNLLIMVLLVLFGCGNKPNVEQLVSHSGVVEVKLGEQWRSTGSAVGVEVDGQEYIITAQHVAFPSQFTPVRVCSVVNRNNCVDVNPRDLIGPIYDQEPTGDWTYFPSDLPEGLKPARIRPRRLGVGESVWVVGCPIGICGEVTTGIVTNYADELYHVDARAIPGNSGGPVFDDRGRVIGLLIAIRITDQLGPVSDWGVVTPIYSNLR